MLLLHFRVPLKLTAYQQICSAIKRGLMFGLRKILLQMQAFRYRRVKGSCVGKLRCGEEIACCIFVFDPGLFA